MGIASRAVDERRRRVLFIEDHAELLATYERTFRHHEVVLCTTGELALVTLGCRDFDLIVCDLHLPGIDGLTVYHRVRATAPELARRFVFATASATRERFRESLEKVDVPVLEKPFGMRVLREMLERVF